MITERDEAKGSPMDAVWWEIVVDVCGLRSDKRRFDCSTRGYNYTCKYDHMDSPCCPLYCPYVVKHMNCFTVKSATEKASTAKETI